MDQVQVQKATEDLITERDHLNAEAPPSKPALRIGRSSDRLDGQETRPQEAGATGVCGTAGYHRQRPRRWHKWRWHKCWRLRHRWCRPEAVIFCL